jgi:ABC-type branched-subunit amino acid transport system permease subunit
MAMTTESNRTGKSAASRFANGMLSIPVLAVLFVAFLLVPIVLGQFWVEVATEILILGLFAASFNLIYGYIRTRGVFRLGRLCHRYLVPRVQRCHGGDRLF